MKFSFKRIIIGLLIISISGLLLYKLTSSLLNRSAPPKENKVFEFIEIKKEYEKNTKNNIDSILNQVIGKKYFFSTVVAEIDQEIKEEIALNRKPNKITNTYNEKVSDKISNDLQSNFMTRPSIIEMKQNLLQNNPSLPGLVNRADITQEYPSNLPGFPKISQPVISPKARETKEDLQQKDSQTNSFSKNISNDQIYYNEQTAKIKYPTNEIRRIIVSVVIDQEHFNIYEYDKEELLGLISKAAGLDKKRGDELKLSILPFASNTFGLQKIFAKNKKEINALKESIHKLRWLLFGIVGLILLGTIWTIIYLSVRSYLRKKKQLIQIQKKQKEEIEIKEKQMHADEISEKKNSILGLAKSKPEDFGAMIVNWVYTEDQIEEPKNAN